VAECKQGFHLSAALRRIEALVKGGRYCIHGDLAPRGSSRTAAWN